MAWLMPSLIAVFISSFLLSLTFLYLYSSEKQKSLLVLALGWGLYSIRFVFMILLQLYPSVLFLFLNQLVNIWSVWLLYMGCVEWLGKKPPRILAAVILAFSSWLTVAVFSGFKAQYYTWPSFIIVGLLFIELGIRFLRYYHKPRLAINILACTLILWGIHKFDYPLLQPHPALMPWGYLIGSVFQIITALAMVLIYFERARGLLIESQFARDRQRQFFENILESIDTGIAVTDKNDIVIYANSAISKFSGIPIEKITGSGVFTDFPKDLMNDYLAAYAKVKRSMKKEFYQTKLISASGEELHLTGELLPVVEKGRFGGVLSTTVDLTRRILLENELREALAEREVLIREIHHRIKNNLSVVLALLSFEGRKLDSEELKGIIDSLSGKIYSIALIHSILYNSDSITHINFRHYLLELTGYIADCYGRAQSIVDLKFGLDENELNIDYTKTLGLIVNELVTNSIKYAFPRKTEKDKIIVDIRAKGDEIILEVSDNGLGYSKGAESGQTGHSGLYLVRTLCDEINAGLETSHKKGSSAIIKFKYSK